MNTYQSGLSSDLTTGTLLLFKFEQRSGLSGLLECCIRCLTGSRYSHAALVWVDPVIPKTSLRAKLESNPVLKNGKDTGYVKLTGVYIWDSDMHSMRAEDNHKHFGVQLTKLKTYMKKWNIPSLTIYRRTPLKLAADSFKQTKLDNQSPKAQEISILTSLYNEYEYRPYDVNCCDWLVACFRCRCRQRNVNSLFCSAFVSLILEECDILPTSTNWTIISPGELSSRSSCGVHWLTWKKEYGPDEEWNPGEEWIYSTAAANSPPLFF